MWCFHFGGKANAQSQVCKCTEHTGMYALTSPNTSVEIW